MTLAISSAATSVSFSRVSANSTERVGIAPLPTPKPRPNTDPIGIAPLPSPKPQPNAVESAGFNPVPSPHPIPNDRANSTEYPDPDYRPQSTSDVGQNVDTSA